MASENTGEGDQLPSLKDVINQLAPRSLALNKLDLELIGALKTVEDRLREHVSTRVAVTLDLKAEHGLEWIEFLVFGKREGRWQLFLESGLTDNPEGWKTQPLASASREKRVLVFTDGLIEKLIRTAANQLDAQICERRSALKTASSILENLAREPVSDPA